MAAGPYEVDGARSRARAPRRRRRSWTGWRAVAAVHPVVALPYGDVDADSLDAAGLGDVVTRSLPGTPGGHGAGPAGPGRRRRGAGETPPPTDESGTRRPRPRTRGRRRGAHPRRRPGRRAAHRPRLGRRRDAARRDPATLQAGGVERGRGRQRRADRRRDAAVGISGSRAAAAHDGHHGIAVPVDALVADPALSGVVGGGRAAPGGAAHGRAALPRRARRPQPAGPGRHRADGAGGPAPRRGRRARGRRRDDGRHRRPALAAAAAPTSLLADGRRTDAGELADPGDAPRARPGRAGRRRPRASPPATTSPAPSWGTPARRCRPWTPRSPATTSVAWRADAEGFRRRRGGLRPTLDRLRAGSRCWRRPTAPTAWPPATPRSS